MYEGDDGKDKRKRGKDKGKEEKGDEKIRETERYMAKLDKGCV